MAKRNRGVRRRARVWGMSVALWEVWRRIPPKHRKRLLQQARTHGPRLARQAVSSRKNRRFSRGRELSPPRTVAAGRVAREVLGEDRAGDPVLLDQVRGRVPLRRARAP